MYNMTIRKWINEVEKNVEELKNDYEILEKQESESMRHEVKNDIKKIRTNLNIIITKVNDLIWIRR